MKKAFFSVLMLIVAAFFAGCEANPQPQQQEQAEATEMADPFEALGAAAKNLDTIPSDSIAAIVDSAMNVVGDELFGKADTISEAMQAVAKVVGAQIKSAAKNYSTYRAMAKDFTEKHKDEIQSLMNSLESTIGDLSKQFQEAAGEVQKQMKEEEAAAAKQQ